MQSKQSSRLRCLLCGALAVALALAWQWLTVRHNFGGDWTGLFYSGEAWPPPPALAKESVKVFPATSGYDGQFYHYVAHDPLLRRQFDAYVDNPRLRWRRILIPGAAHLFAGGRDNWVDAAYFCVELAFLFAGTYWLACFLQQHGITPFGGLAFALVPAALISLERMTIDIALAALAVGFVLYAETRQWKGLYAVLVLAPLARETGLLLVAGCVLSLLAERAWKRALVYSTAAAPWLLWAAYVHGRTIEQAAGWISLAPFLGLWSGTQAAVARPEESPAQMFALVVHGLAAAGIWLALGTAGLLLWEKGRKLGPAEGALALFALLAVFLANPEVWADSYAYGRVMSPLLIWLTMAGVASRQFWMAAPLAMVIPRVATQFFTHWPGILRGMGGS